MTKDTKKRWMASLEAVTPRPAAKRAGLRPSDGRDDASRLGPLRAPAPPQTRAAGAATSKSFTASGLGLTSERSRRSMVERLVRLGITDQRVLEVMAKVPRHVFVDEGLASRAYEDSALPIGYHQTISQPYIVARMTELLCRGRNIERALEIGTGCGYQAAVLAGIAREAYSIERIRALHEKARQNLRPLRIANLRLVFGDGLNGIVAAAPFDAMLIAAAAPGLPQSLLDQLAVGGRAVAPLGDREQTLCLIERLSPIQFKTTALETVRFVPLHAGVR